MSKEKLAEARTLIQRKQYDAARAILEAIPNDPTAQQWLTKLDEIAPRKVSPPTEKPKTQASGSGVVNILIAAVAVIILLVMAGAGGYFAGQSSGKEQGQQDGRETAAQEYAGVMAQTGSAVPSATPSSTASATITFTPTVFDITFEPTLACNMEITTWWNNDAGPLIQEFLDIAETGAATSRGDLSGLVLELSRVKRDFDNDIRSINCGEGGDLRAAVVVGMDFAVDGFNSFLADDAGTYLYFTLANSAFAEAYAILLDYFAVNEFRMRDTSRIWGGDRDLLETLTPAATLAPTIPEGEGFKRTPSPESEGLHGAAPTP
ncbi:MAG: hypothetical protein K8L91_12950 [Anaerolineae bacterium]|nr:hypothetical protein [Anaerolineae bacterium]